MALPKSIPASSAAVAVKTPAPVAQDPGVSTPDGSPRDGAPVRSGSLDTTNLIVHWPLERLRAHQENAAIFGDPKDSAQYETILRSIQDNGIREPLVVKENGTILSGHVRYTCAQKLGLKTVPVRVWSSFGTYIDEVQFLIRKGRPLDQAPPPIDTLIQALGAVRSAVPGSVR